MEAVSEEAVLARVWEGRTDTCLEAVVQRVEYCEDMLLIRWDYLQSNNNLLKKYSENEWML